MPDMATNRSRDRPVEESMIPVRFSSNACALRCAAEGFEYLMGLAKLGGIGSLGEPIMKRPQKRDGFIGLAMCAVEFGESECGTQFQHLCLLGLGAFHGAAKAGFTGSARTLSDHDFTAEPVQFWLVRALLGRLGVGKAA